MAYAQLTQLNAKLTTDFGLEWATKLFGEEAIASLPVYVAGKNKGKPKGFVIWRKAQTSGYCREVSMPLAVGNIADAWIGDGAYTSRSDASRGQWLGRIQPIGAIKTYLFQEGRDAEMTRQAAYKAADDLQWAETKADMEADRLAAR